MAKTIMIVDDEPDILNTVETILKKAGYKTITATNGDDCLDKLQSIKPDLILLDIMMPGTRVSEVIKKIKKIKIVFLSAVRTSDAEKEHLLSSGNVVDYIQKPFDVKDLLATVKKLVSA